MSQQNVIGDIPLIRPRPCAYLGKNYYLYDNFADLIYNNRVGVAANGFRYQDWTVDSGTWTAANGDLRETSMGDARIIHTPSSQAYGTWEFDAKLGSVAATHWYKVYFLYVDANNSYRFFYFHTGERRLIRRVATVDTVVINADIAADTANHAVKITRVGPNWELFWDDVSVGTANAAELTTSNQFRLDVRNTTVSHQFDNIRVYPW